MGEETAYSDWLRIQLDQKGMIAVDLAERSGVHVNTILALLEGRTEKPQQRTRQRIEKALASVAKAGSSNGEPEPESEARPSAEEDGWYYVGLPWAKGEIEQAPAEPGVYIIHDRLGRPAYVGVAHRGAGGIRGRLRDHNRMRWTADTRIAHTFSYALADRMPRADASELARSLEKLLIKFMGNAILINERGVENLEDAVE